MLPWKQRKPQISPVNQNLSSVYVSLAKFQLVSCNLSLAMVWQMTYTHQLSKLCSATITGYSTNTILILVNLFIFATLFLVIVLCAERFIAIHYCFTISRTCDTQAIRCCCRLNLGIKRTVFVGEAVDPSEYYARGFWHYTTCMYYRCHFLQYQNLLVRATSLEPNTSAAATTCTAERSNG